MAFQTPITIAEAIENIDNNRYLLPSIQRDFVWKHTKIEWLFDSIMRDFPISSFLFWRVEGDTKNQFKFYSFLKEYREYFKTHNDEYNTSGINEFTAVLDGQQRLTSLYIGLKGSYAYKKKNVRWIDSEQNIPTHKLYLNILEPLKENDEGRIYEFKFLTEEQYNKNPEKWFRVGKILDLQDDFEFNEYLDENDYKKNKFTYKTLSILKNKIFNSRLINYFLEKEQDIDKALNIFIRINSGGEPLSFSDLLMSIAIASWEEKDAKREFDKLIEEIRDKGFFISKDFILKTFLYLHIKDIKFKVSNFSAQNAKEFESKWNNIRMAIISGFDTAKSFGYVDSTLTSKNALLPIIYYIYHRDIYKDFSSKKMHENDRELMRKWLNIGLLKRIFGSHADSILNSIRSEFTSDILTNPIKDTITEFPKSDIMKRLKGTTKDMYMDEDYINNLLLSQKDDNITFSILAMLYPNLDYKNGNFHKDHLHPKSWFNKESLKDKEVDDSKFDFYLNADNYNSILNLQMLDANENTSKQDKPLKEWAEQEAKKQNISIEKFCENHLMPNILEFERFDEFIEARRKILVSKLINL